MKSATLTRHLRSSGCSCMHVSYGLHNLRICFPIELVHLKVDISLSIVYIFLMSIRQRYTRSFALKFTETETAKSTSCLLSLFYKSVFCCYCECTQINVESLQIRKMYYSYLYEQKWWRILRASECTGTSICAVVSATVQLPHSAQTLQ